MSDHLIKHARQGLVIFCGAGVSMVPPTCLPSWWHMNEEVIRALCSQVAIYCGEDKTTAWADAINARRNSRRFPPEFQAELITKHFGDRYFEVLSCLDGNTPNAVHLAIAELAKAGHVSAVITTNFDQVLEAAFSQVDAPVDVHFSKQHFEALATSLDSAFEQPACQLLKLHGSVADHHTLVDTLAQRMRGLPLSVITCIDHLLSRYHWLFMGFSGGDLEGNPDYLRLRPMTEQAAGFTWLVRDASTTEPIEAVAALRDLYGAKASTPRGELPAWFFDQFDALLPTGLQPATPDPDDVAARKRVAAEAVVQHTHTWATERGPVRAALVIADILSFAVGMPDEARRLLEQVLSEVTPAERAFVVVSNSLANLLINQGGLDQATVLLQNAIAQLTPTQQADQADLKSTLGLVMQTRGNYQEALDLFEQTYQFALEQADDRRQGIALHNKAMALTAMGNLDAARTCYETELSLVRTQGDAVAQAQVLNNLGELLQQQNLFGEATRHLRDAIKLRERLGNDRGVAHCLGNLAVVQYRQGNAAEANQSHIHILSIFRKLGDRPNEILTLNNLADFARQAEDLDGAVAYAEQGLQLAATYKLDAEYLQCQWKLADIFDAAGRIEEAKQRYLEIQAAYKAAELKNKEAEVSNALGVMLWRHNQLDEAATQFEQAILLYEALSQPVSRAAALGNLALVHRQRGDLQQAFTLLQEKLDVATAHNAPAEAANALYNMGSMLHEQGQLEDALNAFNHAQTILVNLGFNPQAVDILSVMGQICGLDGKISQSLHWFDQAIPLVQGVQLQTQVTQRMASVLELLLKSGHQDLAKEYISRMQQLGAEISIDGL
ncbi:MAG: tetratricopeptide repeat protein [Bacteroidota bacterium]